MAYTRVRDSSLSGKQRAPIFSCRGDSDYDSYHGSRHGRLRDVPPFLQDRSRCGSTHRLLGIAFFSYGHIYIALGERADHRLLFGLVVPTVLALGALVRGRPELARRLGTILNFGSLVLVATPIYRLALSLFAASSLQMSQVSQEFAGLDERIAEAKMEISPDELPDIYFIVLDEYPSSGSPADFDNDEFVHELEGRGFFVASKARSNYINSRESIPSSLNMKYVDESAAKEHKNQLYRMADTHMLGQILNTLGYQYIHVSSGWLVTSTNSNADLVVDFTPSGRVISGPDAQSLVLVRQSQKIAKQIHYSAPANHRGQALPITCIQHGNS